MTTKGFKFDLEQQVQMTLSDETGIVRGRSEHVNANDQYYVAYKAADGRQTSAWWDESMIKPA